MCDTFIFHVDVFSTYKTLNKYCRFSTFSEFMGRNLLICLNLYKYIVLL